MQAYSDPTREDQPYALPDVEVFHSDDYPPEEPGDALSTGWYYWFCFPGCLPDSDPIGPFDTAQDAMDDAQDNGEPS